MSLAQADLFSQYLFRLHLFERLRNIWDREKEGGSKHHLLLRSQSQGGGLPYHFVFRLKNDPAFSRTAISFCLFMLQGVKQGGGSILAF